MQQRALALFLSFPADLAQRPAVIFVKTKVAANRKLSIAVAMIMLIVSAEVINYGVVESKRFPVPRNMCELMRQTALDECAAAFEDSYYTGGFSGKDMDFRLVRDSGRCQRLGTNIFNTCDRNAKTD